MISISYMENFDFGKKKKKKTVQPTEPTEPTEPVVKEAPEFVPGPRYDYEFLVSRVFDALGPTESAGQCKVRAPVIYQDGKKTIWENFVPICNALNRDTEHVLSFVFAETGSTGSLDAKQRLLLKGRFKIGQIETLLKAYITEYVRCHTCKNTSTELEKENRLTFMQCSKCRSRRSVAPISTGFRVATKEARQKNRD